MTSSLACHLYVLFLGEAANLLQSSLLHFVRKAGGLLKSLLAICPALLHGRK